MRKVLIVDDEAMIREGLRYVIDWAAFGYEIVGTAENGEVGLEKIKALAPDVVIADIKMPGKNGLEMVRAAIDQSLDFYAIILSGYSDFEYARQALQLGAVNYLLKPVNEDELIDILQKINHQEDAKQHRDQVSMWHDKLFGNDSTGVTCYPYVKLLRIEEQHAPEALKLALSKEVEDVVLLTYRHYHYFILLNQHAQNDLIIDSLCQSLLPKQEILVSHWFNAHDNLTPLVEDIQMLEATTFLLPQQLLSYNVLEAVRHQSPMVKEARESLLKAIFDRKDLKGALAAYWQTYYYELSHEDEIKWRVNGDIEWLYQQIIGKVPIDLEWSAEQNHQQIYLCQTLPMLKKMVNQQLEKLSLTIASSLNHLDIVDELIRYTQENYQTELTLKKIGEIFNYNSAYLGKKFRKETGKNYLSFLDEVRMEKASDILSHSNFMVYEVAEMVGYTNSDYFYKKFKQHFDVSPNEYRQGLKQA